MANNTQGLVLGGILQVFILIHDVRGTGPLLPFFSPSYNVYVSMPSMSLGFWSSKEENAFMVNAAQCT